MSKVIENQEASTSPEDTPAHATSPVMTAEEVAQLLRVNRKTVYTAFKQGEIPGGRRIGGTIRFSRARVLDWLGNGQERGSRSPGGVR